MNIKTFKGITPQKQPVDHINNSVEEVDLSRLKNE